jgi:hypothetical protein
VITEGSPSWLEEDGSVRRTALLGLISVVARMKNTNNRNTRSVIDDAENEGLVLKLLLIAASFSILSANFPKKDFSW